MINITLCSTSAKNIKRIREERGLTQQSVADLIAMHRSNYSRVKTGDRDLSIDAIGKVAKYFNLTIDQLVNLEGDIAQEINIEDNKKTSTRCFFMFIYFVFTSKMLAPAWEKN